jgi:ABC-2 type transport system ATP-binding protein
MIEIKNVTKKYNEHVAINDLTLGISSGEVVGLLGPNGAGKSTTMKVISGILLPDHGDVHIENESIRKNQINVKRKIGFMPENNPLYKDMLVSEAIQFAMDIHSIPKNRQKKRVDEVVDSTGIGEVFYRPIGELSKGYKQRVGLAQVLVHDPKVLILDEPTEGLDPNQRIQIRNLIQNLGKDRTVIISTHVMQEVEAMCSRIIIINNGKVVIDGQKGDIARKKFDVSQIMIKVKGEKVFSTIKNNNIPYESIEESSLGHGMTILKVNTKDDEGFIVEFSRLSKQNDWIIFELIPQQQNLEDLFRELTK